MTKYQKENPETIQAMFGSIAKNYDRTNAIQSLMLHRHWNNFLIEIAQRTNPRNKILDLCCGTGDIAFGLLKNTPKPCQAYLLDFCPEMLECAKEKAGKLKYLEPHSLRFLQADAQKIPLPANSIDCATVAYGIRNVKDPVKCVQEAFRVLRKGGSFSILELTQPENRFLRWGHAFYLKNVIPLLGKIFTSNQRAYSYLQNSIKAFTPPQELEKILKQAGFKKISRESLTGGIATIITGVKP